ncbi:MAG: homogentisate 1,2-dioxygenase, partial [Bacteroidia bacterium]|nr:homogentisate 1,2-dioxygenase [Bacteroidia bacterium]
MPIYQKAGIIPAKRHTVFRKPNGELYHEELVGTEGFSSLSSLVYHSFPPTMVKQMGDPYSVRPKIAIEDNLKALSFKGFSVAPETDYIKSRKTLFVNNDLSIALAAPSQSMESYFFKNADCDELIFIHQGNGRLKTYFGTIDFEYGDYIVIPRGTVYKLEFDSKENRHLIIESHSPVKTPKRYRNDYGQLLEHSPFCERDIKLPHSLHTHEEFGDFEIRIKKRGLIYPYVYQTHPFDVVGWDGYNYPYAFSIHNFEPITGR